RHTLIRLPVRAREVGQRVRDRAELEQTVPLPLDHGLPLLLGHRELHQVLALVGQKLRPILGLHQRVEELIEVIALTRALGVEYPRAGDVFVLFLLLAHRPIPLSMAVRGARPTRSGAQQVTTKTARGSRSEEHTSELQSRENLVC